MSSLVIDRARLKGGHNKKSIFAFKNSDKMVIYCTVTLYNLYTDAQAGLALYWWLRLITFGSSRLRANSQADQVQVQIFNKYNQ